MINKKTYLIAFSALVVLTIAIFMLPRIPKETQERVQGLDGKINQGIALVENGENPMQGIQMLLQVLEEDPKNTKVLYNLALFSLRSGQYEKAVDRLETLQKLENPYEELPYLLAVSHANLGNNEKAKTLLQNLQVEDEELQHAINELMLNLD